MKSNDWKDRLGVMYSTNPDFQYNTGNEEEEETLPKEKQQLRIALDKRNRGGKARDIGNRLPGNDQRSGSTWEVLESEMRCRRLGQRWRNHRTGRPAS